MATVSAPWSSELYRLCAPCRRGAHDACDALVDVRAAARGDLLGALPLPRRVASCACLCDPAPITPLASLV